MYCARFFEKEKGKKNKKNYQCECVAKRVNEDCVINLLHEPISS